MSKTEPKKTICYHGGTVPVRLGDIVNVRIFFGRHDGRIVYVPGISPKNPEMEFNQLTYIGVRVQGKAMMGFTVIPETNSIKKSVRFLRRGPVVDPVTPDENLFEDEEGNPL